MSTMTARRVRTVGRLMGAGLLATILFAGSALANDDRKLDRQIDIFERVLDDMLVESPNWLVQGRHDARGRYRAGTGARFSFDASLVSRGWRGGGNWWKGFWHHDDDDVIVIDLDDFADMDDDDWDEMRRSRRKYSDRAMKKQERLYKRGKTEMIEVMADFGDLLTKVPDNETLELVAYLDDASYFYDKDIRELSMKVRMSDVRAYSDGDLSEKEFVAKITVTED